MKALILAAGYATRLYPLTLDKPKALLPVGNKPIIDRIIEKIEAIGMIDEVIIVANHKFYKNFLDWSKTSVAGIKIKVLDDGTISNDDRLGAIGDIEFAIRKQAVREDLLVIGGDNLFDASLDGFVNFSITKKPYGCVALHDLNDKNLAKKYGVVSVDETRRITEFQEKPAEPKSTMISTCIYFFPQQGLNLFGKYLADSGIKFSKDASGNYITWLSLNYQVYGYCLDGEWYDIGGMESYKKADEHFNS